MPLAKAVLTAVGKYRVNNEAVVYSDAITLVGIDAILSVLQSSDFPIRVVAEGPLPELGHRDKCRS